MGLKSDYLTRGWVKFGPDPKLLTWVNATRETALQTTQDPTHIANWLRHDKTWFAGVNALPNDGLGRVPGGVPLAGGGVNFLQDMGLWKPLDRAQVSVMYPGYPGFDGTESEAAFRYRKNRDAAHVDGLLPEGPDRRRYLREPHSFVLGIPMVETSGQASPMVVWDKSHEIMRAAFRGVLENVPQQDWANCDLTDAYHAARKRCFETCERIEIPAQPGESYILHRLCLHGIAPWGADAKAPVEGRVIAYFRPDSLGGLHDWLYAP